jgi:L-lactate dehydrogenase complex protein LldF
MTECCCSRPLLQLDDDAPSHIVTPMIHKDRTAAVRAFARRLGLPESSDPETLTRYARAHLREAFLAADLGIPRAYLVVAASVYIDLCTNEGNGRLSAAAPRVHIAVAGIEKLVPTLEHLGVFLELLARSATGQPLTVYTSFVARPRQADESDGPREIHLVLLDAGRSAILADPTFREALRCIRCGACLNVCPVYRVIGGHAYGSVYPGPIGAVLTPLLRGPAATPDLPWASTLCGACRPACPVDIDLPGLLVAHRARADRADHRQRRLPRLLAFVMGGRRRWRIAGKLLQRQPTPGKKSGWDDVVGRRTMPAADARPFHARWKLLQPRLAAPGGRR